MYQSHYILSCSTERKTKQTKNGSKNEEIKGFVGFMERRCIAFKMLYLSKGSNDLDLSFFCLEYTLKQHRLCLIIIYLYVQYLVEK